jgi:hypothetical protein
MTTFTAFEKQRHKLIAIVVLLVTAVPDNCLLRDAGAHRRRDCSLFRTRCRSTCMLRQDWTSMRQRLSSQQGGGAESDGELTLARICGNVCIARITLALKKSAICAICEGLVQAPTPTRVWSAPTTRFGRSLPTPSVCFAFGWTRPIVRLTAVMVTDSGAFETAGLTRHHREAANALPLRYGPARGVARALEEFGHEPCNWFEQSNPRVGNRLQHCIDTHDPIEMSSFAEASPIGFYYLFVHASQSGWSGSIVPQLTWSGPLSESWLMTKAVMFVAQLQHRWSGSLCAHLQTIDYWNKQSTATAARASAS